MGIMKDAYQQAKAETKGVKPSGVEYRTEEVAFNKNAMSRLLNKLASDGWLLVDTIHSNRGSVPVNPIMIFAREKR